MTTIREKVTPWYKKDMLTVAIGDIHGCLDELKSLLEFTKQYTVDHPTRYIFLGDYIDRGPNSKGVIEHLMSMDNDQNVFLMGNHEDNFLQVVQTNNIQYYLNNTSMGGHATCQSYFDPNMDRVHIPASHIEWIKGRSIYHVDKNKKWGCDRVFVHAGIARDLKLEETPQHIFLWDREMIHENVKYLKKSDAFVVHGHTPMRRVHLTKKSCNLDTGCVFGPSFDLTAAIFNNKKIHPIKLVNHRGVYTDVAKID